MAPLTPRVGAHLHDGSEYDRYDNLVRYAGGARDVFLDADSLDEVWWEFEKLARQASPVIALPGEY